LLCADNSFGQDGTGKGEDLFSENPNSEVLAEVEKALTQAKQREGAKAEKDTPADPAKPQIFTTQTAEGGKAIGENDIRMTSGGKFELHVPDAELRLVLQHLSTLAKTNIIVSRNVAGTVTADLYSVSLLEALEAILTANGLVYRQKGNFIYVYTAEEYEQMREVSHRIFRLGYLQAKDAKTLLSGALSKTGKIAVTPEVATGITADSGNTGGMGHASSDVIIVYDYEENLKKVAEMLKVLDIMPRQVLIEATILSAKLTEGEALGVDLSTLFGVNYNAMGAVGSMTNLNSPYPNTGAVPNVNPGVLPNFSNNALGTTQTFAANVPAGAATFGLVTNHVALFIKALETVTDVTVVANPKLLVVNKHRGEVLIGKRDGYLTTTVTETASTQTVEFLETGTKLLFRPFIGTDDYIRLEIHPEDSSGSVAQVGTDGPALPSSTTTEVTTNVFIRDGRTIVIGGLFRDDIQLDREQIPGVGDLPGIGAAFRSTNDTTVREEVIILITAHIIDHGPDEAVSERIKDDIERCRVGARLGLRWWSRSRLASNYMRSARQEATNGNTSWALWNVDMALNIDPQMSEAIQLKERLTQLAYWADAPMAISTRHVVTRMMMQEIGMPYQRVVTPRRPADSGKLPKRVRNKFGIMKKPTYWPKPKYKKMTRKRSHPKGKPQKVIDLEKIDQPENPSLTPQSPKKSGKDSSNQREPAKNMPIEGTKKEVPKPLNVTAK
jgi:type IV pilus assembly protein PilQ